jgi:hypothetical protein
MEQKKPVLLSGTVCRWTEDEDGVWDTECDEKHCFIVDGPRENNHAFCPYCGGLLLAEAAVVEGA